MKDKISEDKISEDKIVKSKACVTEDIEYPILSISWHPDGKHFATGSYGDIFIWHADVDANGKIETNCDLKSQDEKINEIRSLVQWRHKDKEGTALLGL